MYYIIYHALCTMHYALCTMYYNTQQQFHTELRLLDIASARDVVVMIVACQVMDTSSIHMLYTRYYILHNISYTMHYLLCTMHVY